MKRALTAAAAVVATVALAACGNGNQPLASASSGPSAAPSGPTGFTIVGTLTVEASTSSDSSDGGDCYASDGGYSDVRMGAGVTIKDETGTVVALGNLDPGHTIEPAKCTFGFSVVSVPEGKKFYSVEVAHRGEVRYTRADLSEPLTLTLG